MGLISDRSKMIINPQFSMEIFSLIVFDRLNDTAIKKRIY